MNTTQENTAPIEVEASPIDRQIGAALATFSPSDAGIAKLAAQAEGLTIDGIGDREGYKAVSTLRKEVKAVRVEVEKARKALKADALKFGRSVDGEAKRITAALSAIEDPLLAQERAIDDERAEIKAAEEAAAKAVLDDRMAALQAVGAEVPVSTVAEWPDEEYTEMLGEYTARHEAAEAKRIEEERKVAEEAARIEAEAQAKRDAEDAERKAEAARLAEERKALDAEKAAAQAERDKLDAERREIEHAKQVEAEKAQAVEAERERVAQEKRAAELKAQREAELKAKRDAARPDAEKLRALAKSVYDLDVPPLEEGNDWACHESRDALAACRNLIQILADTLDGGAAA